MSRQLKRVPLDFNWELGKKWKGYVNPYYEYVEDCPFCHQTGLNKKTKRLQEDFYGIHEQHYEWAVPGKIRWNTKAWQHFITQEEVNYLWEKNRLRRVFKEKPTADEVNEWSKTGIGHDGINQYYLVKFRAEKLGIYGECEYCKGEGEIWVSEDFKKKAESWEEYDPPAGEGYQLWETTSEGSPISPVFETLEELCDYLERERVSFFGDITLSKEDWYKCFTEENFSVRI